MKEDCQTSRAVEEKKNGLVNLLGCKIVLTFNEKDEFKGRAADAKAEARKNRAITTG